MSMEGNKEKEEKGRYNITVYNDDRVLREKLEKHAKEENRSLSGQVLTILKEYAEQTKLTV